MDIVKYLKDNVEPINDNIYGLAYRASATLKDGTYLPCVIFSDPEKVVDLAIKRFKEEKSGKSIFGANKKRFGYREIVKNFVSSGNRLNIYDIDSVEKSRFAIPLNISKQIEGETAMSWTAFVAEFIDGRKLSFGTTWNWEFFDLPHDYDFKNVNRIISGGYLSKENQFVPHKSIYDFQKDLMKLQPVHREKPFFKCYIDNL